METGWFAVPVGHVAPTRLRLPALRDRLQTRQYASATRASTAATTAAPGARAATPTRRRFRNVLKEVRRIR